MRVKKQSEVSPVSPLWAGFECGHLGWCDQDLLIGTRHTPATDDPPPRPELHAIRCGRDLGAEASILAANEPSMWPRLCRRPQNEAIAMAKPMMSAVALDMSARFYTCDPMHGLEESEFAATDQLVATGHVAVVGVNYYPHDARVPLREVLTKAWHHYGSPLAVTETSWHRGRRRAVKRFPAIGNCQYAWLAHVRAEVAASSAVVEGVCWYPWLDQPVWGKP